MRGKQFALLSHAICPPIFHFAFSFGLGRAALLYLLARSSSAHPSESLGRPSNHESRHSRSCREGLCALGGCRFLTGPNPLRVMKRTPVVGGKFSGGAPIFYKDRAEKEKI